ncbi:hypothetical protein [Cellulosimicrobium sp. JZ28]|uniref:hypothetical protein n=1 Tax=Cellulosimicrobium sp. JZ28 TaxID=1906273 RepID=UPI00188BD121|nr:hypothetical protein [Cellulosimicrobium sp. JZ28]
MNARTLTSAELDALPVGAAVRCTTDYGRVVLALKVGVPQGSGGHIWRTTEYSTHPGSFAIAQANAVRLEPGEPGPTAPEVQVASATLTTPAEVDALPARAVIRDAAGTVAENAGGPYPWLTTGFSESWPSEAFVYPVTVLWPLGARGEGGV